MANTRKAKVPLFSATRNEAETLHFALTGAIQDCKNEIATPTREHGMAESAMYLCELQPLLQRVDTWLADNPRPGQQRPKPTLVK